METILLVAIGFITGVISTLLFRKVIHSYRNERKQKLKSKAWDYHQ